MAGMIPDILPVRLSPPDDRDHQRSLARTLVGAITLPDAVDMEVWEKDRQFKYNSCLASVVTTVIEMYKARAGTPVSLSRMHVYLMLRMLSKLHKVDQGGIPRDTGKAVNKFGVVPEASWPYTDENLYRLPPVDVMAEGLADADWEYERIPTPQRYATVADYWAVNTAIKTYLAQDIPIMASFELDSDFERLCTGPWRSHEWLRYKNTKAQILGIHQMLILGYQEDIKKLKVWNPWGPDFGDGGYCGIPYHAKQSALWQSTAIKEMWVVRPK